MPPLDTETTSRLTTRLERTRPARRENGGESWPGRSARGRRRPISSQSTSNRQIDSRPIHGIFFVDTMEGV